MSLCLLYDGHTFILWKEQWHKLPLGLVKVERAMLVRPGLFFAKSYKSLARLVHSSLMHSNVMQHVTNSSLEETSWCELSSLKNYVLSCVKEAFVWL